MVEPIDLSIPSPFRRTLQLVINLGEKDFSAFLSALHGADPTTPTHELSDAIFNAVPALSSSDWSRIVSFSLSTRALVHSLDSDVDSVSLAVVNAFSEVGEGRGISEAESELLRSRLITIFSSEGIWKREKAHRLARSADKVLARSSTITDLRPVFHDTDPNTLVGFVVLNTLKLDVTGRESESIFISADLKTLMRLRELIEHAIEKSQVLKELIVTANQADLTPVAES